MCFKPCYKWITFNTLDGGEENPDDMSGVLNLVINGLPSILKLATKTMTVYITKF